MKIKQDFVTNSSSTSYIAFIPDNFDITKFEDMIKTRFSDIIDDCVGSVNSRLDDENEHVTIEDFLCGMYESFDNLISSGFVEEYGNLYWWIIYSVVEELDLVITDSSVNSDAGMIDNINFPEYKEKIDNIKSGGWGIKYGGWGHESKA